MSQATDDCQFFQYVTARQFDMFAGVLLALWFTLQELAGEGPAGVFKLLIVLKQGKHLAVVAGIAVRTLYLGRKLEIKSATGFPEYENR